MAKVFGPGYSFRARGSVGRVQYRKVKRDNIVCYNVGASRVVTGPQAAVRACMSSLSVLWRTLSSSQLTAWQSYGAAFNFRWGGFAYFTYINMPRCRTGLSLLSFPPGYPVETTVWELDGPGFLRPLAVLSVGVFGLFDVTAVDSFSPAAVVSADTYFDVDLVGGYQPKDV